MNTAQTVLNRGAQTAQVKTIVPWVIGGLVVAAITITALIFKFRK